MIHAPGGSSSARRARPGGHARGLLVGLLVAILGGGVAISRLPALTAARAAMDAPGVPIYIPTGRAARLAAAGHASTAADILYLWAIQHFSAPATDPALRRAWLERVYGTITDLDPQFRDAYWLGYVSILIEGASIESALALVDKALEHEPEFTLLAIEAAMAARHHGLTDRAVHYLDHAGRSGDKLAQRLLLRVRQTETAQEELQGWAGLLDDDDSLTRHVAGEHVRDLTMLIVASELSALVRCYRAERGMNPGSLRQLVAAGYVAEIPPAPDGREWSYDVRTGAVTAPLPYRYRPPSNSRLGVDLSHLGRCAPAQWQVP